MEEKSKAVLTASNISLRFGGVKALAEVASRFARGKSWPSSAPTGRERPVSQLHQRFYRPDPGGSILYQGPALRDENLRHRPAGNRPGLPGHPDYAGMTTLDNLMTGAPWDEIRHPRFSLLLLVPGPERGDGPPAPGGGDHRLSGDRAHPQKYVGELAYGLRKRVDFGRPWPWTRTFCSWMSPWPA